MPFPGGVELTTRERRALLWVAVLGYGWAPGAGLLGGNADKEVARYVGLAALAGEAWGWWKDREMFRNPDTMNGYFLTGGRLSGKRSDAEAAALRGKR